MPRDQSLRLPAFPGDGDAIRSWPGSRRRGRTAPCSARSRPRECRSSQRPAQLPGYGRLAMPGHVPALALEAGQVAGARPLDHRPGGPGSPALVPPVEPEHEAARAAVQRPGDPLVAGVGGVGPVVDHQQLVGALALQVAGVGGGHAGVGELGRLLDLGPGLLVPGLDRERSGRLAGCRGHRLDHLHGQCRPADAGKACTNATAEGGGD